ncbi:HPr family phosphocarrier protein [Thiovibrio sp. JS02]
MNFSEKKITIANQCGLHGRASAKLVEAARCFQAEIRLVRDGEEVDCKSILDVMTMACTKGTPVKIKARGADAEEALAALGNLVENKFGED